MDQERLLARGEFEELKDQLSNINIQIRTIVQDIYRKLPVPDISCNTTSTLDVTSAKALLCNLEKLAEECNALNGKVNMLNNKWKFK